MNIYFYTELYLSPWITEADFADSEFPRSSWDLVHPAPGPRWLPQLGYFWFQELKMVSNTKPEASELQLTKEWICHFFGYIATQLLSQLTMAADIQGPLALHAGISFVMLRIIWLM